MQITSGNTGLPKQYLGALKLTLHWNTNGPRFQTLDVSLWNNSVVDLDIELRSECHYREADSTSPFSVLVPQIPHRNRECPPETYIGSGSWERSLSSYQSSSVSFKDDFGDFVREGCYTIGFVVDLGQQYGSMSNQTEETVLETIFVRRDGLSDTGDLRQYLVKPVNDPAGLGC